MKSLVSAPNHITGYIKQCVKYKLTFMLIEHMTKFVRRGYK